MRNAHALIVAASAAGSFSLAMAATAPAAVTADRVVDYTPGNLGLVGLGSYNGSSPAVGALAGNTDAGYGANGLNPFNPGYQASQLAGIGPGGQLTLHLSSPVLTAGGRTVGVFSNNGLVDASNGVGGQATNPATLFSDVPEAVVSVSADGITYVALNGGNPVLFPNPTNYYTDQPITQTASVYMGVTYYGNHENLGAAVADQGKPFAGTLSTFDGQTFDQIKATLNGSAGGTWLDLSGTGLTVVNDVRFAVPANVSYRMVVDSVSAVPEPASAAVVLLVGGAALLGRRRGAR